MSSGTPRDLYVAIADSLRASYPSITAEQVADVDRSLRDRQPTPHGIVGMFARKALEEARDGNAQV